MIMSMYACMTSGNILFALGPARMSSSDMSAGLATLTLLMGPLPLATDSSSDSSERTDSKCPSMILRSSADTRFLKRVRLSPTKSRTLFLRLNSRCTAGIGHPVGAGRQAGEQLLVRLERVELRVDGLARARIEATDRAAPAALGLAVDLHLERQRLAAARGHRQRVRHHLVERRAGRLGVLAARVGAAAPEDGRVGLVPADRAPVAGVRQRVQEVDVALVGLERARRGGQHLVHERPALGAPGVDDVALRGQHEDEPLGRRAARGPGALGAQERQHRRPDAKLLEEIATTEFPVLHVNSPRGG